jgi:hypothetical protein
MRIPVLSPHMLLHPPRRRFAQSILDREGGGRSNFSFKIWIINHRGRREYTCAKSYEDGIARVHEGSNLPALYVCETLIA